MVLIFGDEVDSTGPVVDGRVPVRFRGRTGTMKAAALIGDHPLECYFLDVGQGDATLIVTPGGKKILIDGGKSAGTGRMSEAEISLIWMYRLDKVTTPLVLDLVVLTHADEDHIGGLVNLVMNPKIEVRKVVHSGIAVYTADANDDALGEVATVDGAEYLLTRHDTIDDLDFDALHEDFKAWINVLAAEHVDYVAVQSGESIDVGDPAVTIEVLGPRVDHLTSPDRDVFAWFGDKGLTINGHSVVLRLTYRGVRFLLSGDLNIEGSEHLMADPAITAKLDAHVLKAPHHGSHEFHRPFLKAVNPQITAISSGEIPDHGHPRPIFLGAVGQSARSGEPLLYSTALSAVFGRAEIEQVQAAADATGLDSNAAFATTRQLFHKLLPGIVNVRTDGTVIYTATRVATGYWWVAYGPLDPAPRTPGL